MTGAERIAAAAREAGVVDEDRTAVIRAAAADGIAYMARTKIVDTVPQCVARPGADMADLDGLLAKAVNSVDDFMLAAPRATRLRPPPPAPAQLRPARPRQTPPRPSSRPALPPPPREPVPPLNGAIQGDFFAFRDHVADVLREHGADLERLVADGTAAGLDADTAAEWVERILLRLLSRKRRT